VGERVTGLESMTDSLLVPAALRGVTSHRTIGDIDPALDLAAEIDRLRREKNAVILAHYYQDGEIQDIADFVGDSLDLSRRAAATDADVIVFCGVRFMAEVAKILSPSKTVLLPDMAAGCSLEDSCQPGPFKAFRERHPDHVAITYINCSAEVKALSDIIVTSSNAEAIIRQIPADKPILFAPDRHLGAYLARKTGREMTLWPGTCIVHERFSERELVRLKARHPAALVAAHPECPEAILRLSDHIGSTRSLLDFVLASPAEEFIIATEPGIIHQMEKQAPHKRFIGAPGADGQCSCNACPFMALNTMEKLYLAMINMTPEITLPEELRRAALKPLERMLAMSPAASPSAPASAPAIRPSLARLVS
jgi:quinolinate synthase